MDKKKMILPVSIIIGCVILGGFFYASQVNKQRSIERQQELKIQADKDMERVRVEAEKETELVKTELENKKYLADRKQDCLNIYNTEDDKWSNVRGWRFDENDDECLIEYKDPDPKTDKECDDLYPIEYSLYKNILCKEGEFEKSF